MTGGLNGSGIEPAAEREFRRAKEALVLDDSVTALGYLEKGLRLHDDPCWYSFLGYCVARERGQFKKGLELCRVSLEHDSGNPDHYFNMGQVYLFAGQKVDAMAALRQGVAAGGGAECVALLEKIGTRKPPVIGFLSRENVLNIWLGLALSRLGLR